MNIEDINKQRALAVAAERHAPLPAGAPRQHAQAAQCQHRIADARNPVVESGYMCVDCGLLFSAADHCKAPPDSRAGGNPPVDDTGMLKEHSGAWHAVVDVLQEVSPGWHNLSQRGMEAAVLAIRALASQASKGAGVPEAARKKITEDRDSYKAAHDAVSGKLTAVWKGIEETVEKFSGEPCKGEPFDRLDELLTRLTAPSPAQAQPIAIIGQDKIDPLTEAQIEDLAHHQETEAQPVASTSLRHSEAYVSDLEDSLKQIAGAVGYEGGADGLIESVKRVGAQPVAVARVREILDGIDRDELEPPKGGWWETSVGADFGAKKLAELEAYLIGAQPVADAEPSAREQKLVERVGWSTKQWYEHVGARENGQDEIVFGTVMALRAMVVQFLEVTLFAAGKRAAQVQVAAHLAAITPDGEWPVDFRDVIAGAEKAAADRGRAAGIEEAAEEMAASGYVHHAMAIRALATERPESA